MAVTIMLLFPVLFRFFFPNKMWVIYDHFQFVYKWKQRIWGPKKGWQQLKSYSLLDLTAAVCLF